MNTKLNFILGIILFIELAVLASWYARSSHLSYDFYKPTLKSMSTPEKVDSDYEHYTYYATNIEIENTHLEEERISPLVGADSNNSIFSLEHVDYYKLLEDEYSDYHFDLDYGDLCCDQVIPAGCTISPTYIISEASYNDMGNINITHFVDDEEYGDNLMLKKLCGYKPTSISSEIK